ncbi:hypothetical protein RFN57_36240 [Streptomyces violaceochromogenes]|uniref:Hydrogenase expression protein HypA n=1 Tax=Streptomyces violaceochromogenes TaxID=67377 RepID=A0ABU6M8G3_9ACTN|nr:hypothetical protein [Streptomyces violaceochromogenes]MEC7057698.1 hypothetical protein [Streptomyces violaceochromogenes]GHC52735.1 hypothetical protein GCM10010309_10200 [Streptomyces violaceochromogenes]
MSPGQEEADEPVTVTEHATHRGSSDPSPHFTVVISGDGSAAVDGEPVPVAEGTTVDAAILDLLHAHARDRNTAVTAAISDPAAGYVAHVEVFPDGSSALRQQEEAAAEEGVTGPVTSLVPEVGAPAGKDRENRDDRDDREDREDRDDHEDRDDRENPDDVDEAAYELPEPERAQAARPVPQPAPARRPGARQSDDEFDGPGLLGRPLVVGPVALGVAALVVVPLVILGSGGSGDGEDREETAVRAGGSPSASASPALSPSSLPIPPPSVSPSATDKAKDKDKDKKGTGKKPTPKDTPGAKGAGGVTVTVTARPPAATTTVTAEPPQDTAASAVKRLAANDPSGRHICYRAYVSGQGWQKPVCDGTIAGTSGRNRPIKALNIAVHGVGGSAANAFRHTAEPVDGRGKWQPSWTAVTGDGRNFTIGSAKRNAPNMLGFAMNVGTGEICNTVRLRGHDWGGRVCSKPRPDFTFGGTLDNEVWLEAVKLTV